MRVIAGEARGRPLRAPKTEATRPTSDKVKGAIFSMIESLLVRTGDAAAVETGEGVWAGKVVLDLYAGSGALGIEALSRGAARCDFVEQERAAIAAIAANLAATGLSTRGRVWPMPVQSFLRAERPAEISYDIILADPPYADPDLAEVVATLSRSPFIAPRTVVVVEHSRRVLLPERCGDLLRVRERRHGDTVASIWLGPARIAELAAHTDGEGEREA